MLTKSQKLLLYIIEKKKVVDDKTKLAKYQYFSDFIHFAFHNKSISGTGTIYSRQKQGPLNRNLSCDLDKLKEEGYIIEKPNFNYQVKKNIKVGLTTEEKKTVDFVLNKYGDLNYKELVNISHNQLPYLSAKEGEIIEFITAYNLVDEYQDYNSYMS